MEHKVKYDLGDLETRRRLLSDLFSAALADEDLELARKIIALGYDVLQVDPETKESAASKFLREMVEADEAALAEERAALEAANSEADSP